MRAYPLQGQVEGGLGPGIQEFLGPEKWHRVHRGVPFGAQKTRGFQGPTPLTCPSNGYACIQNVMHRAV
jgi:hypothetical protein